MKTTTKIFASILGAAVLFALFVSAGYLNTAPGKVTADAIYNNYITKMSISNVVSVTTSSTLVLATSTARSYAIFSNDSANPVYLALNNGLPAIADSGILLNASSTYEIRDVNGYIGSVYAISKGATSNVLVTAAQ